MEVSYPCYAVSDPGRVDSGCFAGDRDLYSTGATSTFERGGDRDRRSSGGARLPPSGLTATAHTSGGPAAGWSREGTRDATLPAEGRPLAPAPAVTNDEPPFASK